MIDRSPLQTGQLDFGSQETLTGFRMQRFELLNWGTFDRHVWRIDPNGRNSLLTGDIGSGKSTLVDALTSLLVPHHRIVYNKAAGSQGRERSLYSYIRGEFKSEQDELTQTARAVALRDEKNFSVLLAHFHNRGFDQGATLAQVFWLKEGQRNPERFFVFSELPLTIAEHFSGFGSDILTLRKRLRALQGVQVLDNFKEYSGRFRRLFGIQQEQALELFYQTVSMKSVGNLTEFVRSHMLEKFNVQQRIAGLRRAFENLSRAHEAVLKARDQIDRLVPLVEDGEHHRRNVTEIQQLTGCRGALEAWFAEHETRLQQHLIERLEHDRGVSLRRLERIRAEVDSLRLKADSLKAGIEDSGGSRLRAIDQEIERLAPERRRRQAIGERYRGHCKALALTAQGDEKTFDSNRREAQQRLTELQRKSQELDTQKTDLAVAMRQHKDQGRELEQELESLRGRKSNIPRRSLEIRGRMARDLGISEHELAFSGELLQVDEQAIQWQGAIERLLHNFGLSLLVPEAHYPSVSRYVDGTHLHGRLVYFRTRGELAKPLVRQTHPDALYRKLHVKPDSPFYEWLMAWLMKHFDHVCCSDLDDFRRHPRAVTRHGQIKTGARRHEKDDRHDLHDHSRYVLGWSNQDKIQALEQRLGILSKKIIRLAGESANILQGLERLNLMRDHARDLLNVERLDEIDWQTVAADIAVLEQEKRAIEESSDTLKDLRQQLRDAENAIKTQEKKISETDRNCAELEYRIKQAHEKTQEAQVLAATWRAEVRERLLPRLRLLHTEALNATEPSLQNLDKQRRTLREHIQAEIAKFDKRRDRLSQKIISAMQAYKNDYPAETQEVDAAVEALAEYTEMLEELQTQDLPRHEARFWAMLKEETIQGVAMFQAQLDKEQREIGDKIDTINRSLKEIEYNPGSYIILLKDLAQDVEIREFRHQLRQLLTGSLNDDELYTEQKFLQVKDIIDRFNGREGLVDQDQRWTRKVTDVRNWFNFSASERYREDDAEKEFYSDAAGKSGGQKEKLAYTILASALAYQFGLEWGNLRSRSFRFVVIDEAFGKGSDESTRYALELFKKLNLQLLIATPLQKIHVIEDYINAVHFVCNEGGNNSVIHNLTVEEYREKKQKFRSERAI